MLESTSSRSASPCPADPVPGRGGLSAGGVPERALFQEAGQSRISPPGCREPSGLLPTMQWLPRSGLTPWPCWEPLPPRSRNVVLAGRATHVPQAAVTSGIQRTVTVTSRRPVGWVHAADLGWGSGPKLHGMQGVRGSNPLSSTPGQRPCSASTAQESLASGSKSAAVCFCKADLVVRHAVDAGQHHRGCRPVDPAPTSRALSGRSTCWSWAEPAWRGTPAGGTGTGPAAQQGLQLTEQLPQRQADAAGFGRRSRSRVRKPWATDTRVTWWCQPPKLRPS
jgi:hypothetical protein